MNIALIVAMSQDRAIGRDNRLLWHLSSDLKRFKALTSGHTIIMGRKTYESLPNGALPNRRNVVISRSLAPQEGIDLATNLEEALSLVEKEEKVFVIGGGEIYAQFVSFATELHLTIVEHQYPDADTFFPEINLETWVLDAREVVEIDERNPLRSTYYHYKRNN